MVKAAETVDRTAENTKRNARKAAANPWTERLMRFGHIVRGVIYIIPGILALQLATGSGGAAVNLTSAIQVIGQQPNGKALLALVAIGLVGYSIWGIVRALFDPFHEGDDAEGLLIRIGYIVSALGYATLLVATLQYMMGTGTSGSNPQDWTAKLMGQPYGRVLVGGIGLAWTIGGGLRQIYDGYTAGFKKNLQTSQMTADERKWAIDLGRFGIIARGVVFTIMGLFLVQAAVFANPGAAKGLDGALLELVRQPYGPLLLAIVALGLISFGVYSIISARWMKVRVNRPQPQAT